MHIDQWKEVDRRLVDDVLAAWDAVHLAQLHRHTSGDDRALIGFLLARVEGATPREVAMITRLVSLFLYYRDDRSGDPDVGQGAESAARTALCNLAAVYADHPDFDEEWRPVVP